MEKTDNLTNRIKLLIGDQSVTSFARKCGLNESSVRQYLAGSIPGADRALQIADAMGVNLEWLVAGRGPMRPGESAQSGDVQGEPVDLKLIEVTVATVEEALQKAGTKLSPEEKGILCASMYLVGRQAMADESETNKSYDKIVDIEPFLRIIGKRS